MRNQQMKKKNSFLCHFVLFSDIVLKGQGKVIGVTSDFLTILPPPNHRQMNIFPSKRKLMMSSPNAWSSVTSGSDSVYSLTCSMFIPTQNAHFRLQT